MLPNNYKYLTFENTYVGSLLCFYLIIVPPTNCSAIKGYLFLSIKFAQKQAS